MTQAELDLEAGMWTIPAVRSKNKQEHRVPLSDLALEIINAQIADNADLARPDATFQISDVRNRRIV